MSKRRLAPCAAKCEVYSRIVGYYRPVKCWNNGKMEEYKNRKTFKINKTEPNKRKRILVK